MHTPAAQKRQRSSFPLSFFFEIIISLVVKKTKKGKTMANVLYSAARVGTM